MYMTCVYNVSITQSAFTALKMLCASSVHSSSPGDPGNHGSFCCLHSHTFPRMYGSQSRRVCSLSDRLLPRSGMHLSFLRVSSWLGGSSLSSTESYSVIWMDHG